MIKDTADFLLYLKNLNPEKKELNTLLNAQEGQAFAYYIAPLENVIKMHEMGGIFPRNFAHGYFDLSHRSIQSLRNKNISFTSSKNWDSGIPFHDCVNLFLNPINDTFFQFRRNAIIRSRSGSYYLQSVCILEIDLTSLFTAGEYKWSLTLGNFASMQVDHIENVNAYKGFPWKQIFQLVKSYAHTSNSYQSSELIIYAKPLRGKPTIPMKHISRVLVFKKDVKRDHNKVPQSLLLTLLEQPSNVRSLNDPIHADRKFLQQLKSLVDCGLPIDSIKKILCRLIDIENEIGLSILQNYDREFVRDGNYHGIAHTFRVMFWVLILAKLISLQGQKICDDEIRAALVAAFIHDMARESNGIDDNHANRAAIKFEKFLVTKYSSAIATQCLNAVRVHSQIEDPVIKELAWVLLKDANALDRGRYDLPDRNNGCKKKFLRLEIFNNEDLADALIWGGYYLSKITQFINFGEDPDKKFVNEIIDSLYCVEKNCSLTNSERRIANELYK